MLVKNKWNIENNKYGKGVRPMRLLDQLRLVIRKKHYSRRTEQACVAWIKRFILFYEKRHPEDMEEKGISQYIFELVPLNK
ncbi:MAG: phage integrase N-terminal SAM-like domain-containing protein [Desulfobacterales bacterium]|nr:phage integrase N-terminal SAM-like domain-containing protein [Desulfobacterales bacterium]